MKIVLVTGANRGLGFEICRQLDELGILVIMGSRDIDKGIIAASKLSDNVIVKQLDIRDEESIQELYRFIELTFGKLDVLINNAGIGESGGNEITSLSAIVKKKIKLRFFRLYKLLRNLDQILRKAALISQRNTAIQVSMARAKSIMDTNFFGSWRMCQVFAPLLSKSNDARIINISSGMGQLQSLTGFYPAYSLSKSSLNALTIMLSRELENQGITVNAMCPGWIKTDMGGTDAPLPVSKGADTAVWLATKDEIPNGKFFKERKEIPW